MFFGKHVRPRLDEAENRRAYVVISDAFRSTVVIARGSLPGESTSRGWRSNVKATERQRLSFAAATVRARTP